MSAARTGGCTPSIDGPSHRRRYALGVRYLYAAAATGLLEYLNRLAEARWYPLAADMQRWLAIALGLFVFFGVLKLFQGKHSNLD